MTRVMWIVVAALVVAIGAPAAMADSSETYTFVGTGYFQGTDMSFTSNGPAVLGDLYSVNSGSTDLFVLGTDEGTILDLQWEVSPFFFGTPTLQMSLLTALDMADGPTIAGVSIPGVGTYTEFFGHGTLTVTSPEPTSSALTLAGLGLLALVAARRKRSAAGEAPAN
jgi:PEP-CTERM motif